MCYVEYMCIYNNSLILSTDVKSIASLRNSKGLNRFVYISCSPKAALRNWLDLARPSSKQYKGKVMLSLCLCFFLNYFHMASGNPFVVKAAVGVDMFPHTHHKEMVLLFERTVDKEDEADASVTSPKDAESLTAGAGGDDTEMVSLERDQTQHENPIEEPFKTISKSSFESDSEVVKIDESNFFPDQNSVGEEME